MMTYTHHISGRLRTRYPQLKNNSARAKEVEAAIRGIDGVVSVEVNTVTGSLLIHYDAGATGRQALLDTLYRTKQGLGLIQASPPPARAAAGRTNTLADKLLSTVVEKCIERSAIALFSALLL